MPKHSAQTDPARRGREPQAVAAGVLPIAAIYRPLAHDHSRQRHGCLAAVSHGNADGLRHHR